MKRVVVFTLDAQSYGLPLEQVERVVRAVEIVPLFPAPACVEGLIIVQGEAVPVLNLRRHLGFPEREIEPEDQLIVARLARRRVALVVDETVDVSASTGQDAVSSEIADDSTCVCGSLKVENGMIPVLDLNRFLSVEEEEMLDRAMNS
jgi:purine-binding chemotaxis protein CheW